MIQWFTDYSCWPNCYQCRREKNEQLSNDSYSILCNGRNVNYFSYVSFCSVFAHINIFNKLKLAYYPRRYQIMQIQGKQLISHIFCVQPPCDMCFSYLSHCGEPCIIDAVVRSCHFFNIMWPDDHFNAKFLWQSAMLQPAGHINRLCVSLHTTLLVNVYPS